MNKKNLFFCTTLILLNAIFFITSIKAHAGIFDGSRTQSGSVNNNFFSENILKGENVYSGYTSFPQTYSNYLNSVSIRWENTIDFLGNKYGLIEDNVGDTLVGRFTLPRQYIFGDYSNPRSKNLIIGADIGGAPNRNELNITASELYSDNSEFEVNVNPEDNYNVKTPRANGSSSQKYGVIADYQSFKITVTRKKNAQNTRTPNFQLKINWRFNPAYGDTFGSYWYDNYVYNTSKDFYIYSKKADPIKKQLEVTTKEGIRLIGQEKVGEVGFKPEDFINNVKINGKVYDNNYFNYSFMKKPGTLTDYPNYLDYSSVGKQPVYLKVSEKADEQNEVYTESNIITKWGSTIGSNNIIYPDATGFALSLLNGNNGKPYLVSHLGNGVNSTNWINDYYGNNDYIKVKVYQNSGTSSLEMQETPAYINFIMKGNQSITDASARWNSLSNLGDVSYGDIVEYNVPLSDGQGSSKDNNWVMRNEVQSFENLGKESVYYEITNNGFKTLHFNHLANDKTFEIFTSDTAETLLTKLQNKEFITNGNYSSVEVMKFSKYPDNSKAGNTQGKIQVREKLSNGNYATYEYEVPFLVKDDSKVTANPVNKTISLGSDFNKISPKDLVTDIKFGNKPLEEKDYTISMQNSISTDTIGDKIAKILITYKKDTSKTLYVDVPIKVLWGNTLVSKDFNFNYITSSVSLLDNDGHPILNANKGDGKFGNAPLLYARPIIRIFNSNLNEATDEISYETVNQTPESLISKWNKKFSSINSKLSYGDVISYTVYDYRVSDKNHNGQNTWVSRNEELIKETEGYDTAFYELTKNGYSLLHINQLSTKKVTVPIYSSEKYLDEHISDYIDLKGFSNINIKEFSQYPNTKASGQQKGNIIVEETLTTGKKVQYEYEVTFIIGEGDLTYKVPKSLTFNTLTKSKNEQVIQRTYSGDLGLSIKDSRGEGKQGNWRLTAQVNQSEELAPYLIFRDDNLQDKYLNQGAVEIYSQAKQSNPTEPNTVEISSQWLKNTGILLKVPSKNNLSSKQYTSKITWNIVEGP